MKSIAWSFTGLALAALGIVVAVKFASHVGGLELVTAWTRDLGVFGMAVFALVSAVSVVFFFPGSILMTASGAAFGLAGGFVVAQVAMTLGAALAFLVSRYGARRRVERWVSTKPRFVAVDEAIGEEGWKIVLLTRCCPLFPYIFQNYAYGLTRVRFGHYAIGSFIGIVPATLVFVYVGALGRAGAEVASGGASTVELASRVLGFAATVVVSIYIMRVATRALERAGL